MLRAGRPVTPGVQCTDTGSTGSAQEHACGSGLAPTIFTFLLLAILVQYNG
jgi:hypothetical protein